MSDPEIPFIPPSPLPLPVELAAAPPIQMTPLPRPPEEIIPQVSGVISNALGQLSEGKRGGFIGLYEKRDGNIQRAQGAFVQRIGDNVTVLMWVGKEWGPVDKGIEYGAAVRWEW